jgi:hypothetical protein
VIPRPYSRTELDIGRINYYARVFAAGCEGGILSPEQMTESVARLWAFLRERKIAHVLVDGIALLQYVDGRNTEVIDLIMAAPGLDLLPEIEITDRNNYFATGMFDDLRIDLLLTENPLFATVQRSYTTVRAFAGETVPCATVEGLILLKLYALPALYRSGDFARIGLYENDVATLYNAYRPALEPLVVELRRHLNASDFNEVQGIMVDIQRRIARFKQKRGPSDPRE